MGMQLWIKAVHVIGFVMWTGSLVACLSLLRRHSGVRGDAREVLSEVERKLALSMDIGAAVAIAAGLYLALGFGINWFKTGTWLHFKLLFVAGLIGVHGFTRMKVGKFRKDESTTMPAFVLPLTFILLTAVIVFATVKP